MWFRSKRTVVDPDDLEQAYQAIARADKSLTETREREPEVNQLVYEMKKADPFGAGLIQAMGSRHK